MTAALSSAESFPASVAQPTLTLLDLVVELSAAGGNEEEIVFAVLDLVQTGRVRLLGQVREGDFSPAYEHPLKLDGYATIGDWHTSRPLEDADVLARDSRFLGLKQECGLHLA